jgi:hypothetical protein
MSGVTKFWYGGVQNLSHPSPTWSLPIEAPHRFAIALVLLVFVFAVLAAYTPIWSTLITVCAFGGPHNYAEYRYFLSRLPSRFGPLRAFFITAFAGAIILFLLQIVLTQLFLRNAASNPGARPALFCWNELLILWMFALSILRYRSTDNTPKSLLVANSLYVALATAANLLSAAAFSISLTYLHPLLGLWILERELKRTRKSWVAAYRWCLLSIPFAAVAILCALNNSHNANPSPELVGALNGNALGAQLFPNASTMSLLALFGFLQMVHYGVWLIAMPIANRSWKRWRIERLPIIAKKPFLRPFILVACGLGVLAILFFWCGYVLDYDDVNEIYITITTLHVMAEVPFIFWMCES